VKIGDNYVIILEELKNDLFYVLLCDEMVGVTLGNMGTLYLS
jgi:hypothetical protein